MCIQIVCDKYNLFCPGIQRVRGIFEDICKIQCSSGFCYNRFSPACERFRDHKDIRNTITDIYGIHFLRMPRFTGNTGFFYKLFICFIYADNGDKRVIWTLVNFQHIFHLCHKFSICLWDTPFLYKPRFNLVFFITSQTVVSVI